MSPVPPPPSGFSDHPPPPPEGFTEAPPPAPAGFSEAPSPRLAANAKGSMSAYSNRVRIGAPASGFPETPGYSPAEDALLAPDASEQRFVMGAPAVLPGTVGNNRLLTAMGVAPPETEDGTAPPVSKKPGLMSSPKALLRGEWDAVEGVASTAYHGFKDIGKGTESLSGVAQSGFEPAALMASVPLHDVHIGMDLAGATDARLNALREDAKSRGWDGLASFWGNLADFKSNARDAAWSLTRGESPYATPEQQAEQEETLRTNPTAKTFKTLADMAQVLVKQGPFGQLGRLGEAAIAEGAPRVATRLAQGAAMSLPGLLGKYDSVRTQYVQSGMSEDAAEAQALKDVAKSAAINVPTMAMIMSSRVNNLFKGETVPGIIAKRGAKSVAIGGVQALGQNLQAGNGLSLQGIAGNTLGVLPYEMYGVGSDILSRGGDPSISARAKEILAAPGEEGTAPPNVSSPLMEQMRAKLQEIGEPKTRAEQVEAQRLREHISMLEKMQPVLDHLVQNPLPPEAPNPMTPRDYMQGGPSPQGEINAVQEQGATGQVSSTGEGGQDLSQGGAGVRPGEQGPEAPGAGKQTPEAQAIQEGVRQKAQIEKHGAFNEDAIQTKAKDLGIDLPRWDSSMDDGTYLEHRAAALRQNPEAFWKLWQSIPETGNGKIINGDILDMLLKGDHPNPYGLMDRVKFNDPMQGTYYDDHSSELMKTILKNTIREPAKEGERVVFMGGSPGTAKSTTAQELVRLFGDKIKAVVDSPMRDAGKAIQSIDQTLDRGYGVDVHLMGAPPEEAMHRTMRRSPSEQRGVSPLDMADLAARTTRDNPEALVAKYGDDPRVNIHFDESRDGKDTREVASTQEDGKDIFLKKAAGYYSNDAGAPSSKEEIARRMAKAYLEAKGENSEGIHPELIKRYNAEAESILKHNGGSAGVQASASTNPGGGTEENSPQISDYSTRAADYTTRGAQPAPATEAETSTTQNSQTSPPPNAGSQAPQAGGATGENGQAPAEPGVTDRAKNEASIRRLIEDPKERHELYKALGAQGLLGKGELTDQQIQDQHGINKINTRKGELGAVNLEDIGALADKAKAFLGPKADAYKDPKDVVDAIRENNLKTTRDIDYSAIDTDKGINGYLAKMALDTRGAGFTESGLPIVTKANLSEAKPSDVNREMSPVERAWFKIGSPSVLERNLAGWMTGNRDAPMAKGVMTDMVATQMNRQNNVYRDQQAINSIMGDTPRNSQAIRDQMRPLVRQKAILDSRIEALNKVLEPVDKAQEAIRAMGEDPIRRMEAIAQVKKTATMDPSKEEVLRKQRGDLQEKLQELGRVKDATMQALAERYPDARVYMAVDAGDRLPSWLDKSMSPVEKEQAKHLKEWFDTKKQALSDAGMGTIDAPYIHRTGYDLLPNGMQSKLSDLGLLPKQRKGFADPEDIRFAHRQENGTSWNPDLFGSLEGYIGSYSHKLAARELASKWVGEDGASGFASELAADGNTHLAHAIRSSVENYAFKEQPLPFVSALTNLMYLKHIMGSVPTAMKHAMKLPMNISQFGPVATAQGLGDLMEAYSSKVAPFRALMSKEGLAQADMKELVRQAHLATQGLMDNVTFGDTPGMEKMVNNSSSMLKFLAHNPVQAVEAVDRSLSLFASLREAKSKGLEPAEATQKLAKDAMAINFLGVDRPGALRNPLVRLAFPFQNAPIKLTELGAENMGRIVTSALKASDGDFQGAKADAAKAIRYLAVVGGLGYAFKKWTDSNVDEMMVHPPAPVQMAIGAAGNLAGHPNRFSNTRAQEAIPILGEGLSDIKDTGAPGLLKLVIPDEAMRILQGMNNSSIPKRFGDQEWRRQLGLPSASGEDASLEKQGSRAIKTQQKNTAKLYQSLGIK